MSRKVFRRTTVAVLVAILALATAPTAMADGSGLYIVPPQASSAQIGQTYGELSAAWWLTMLAIPVENNPTFDTTGTNCGFGETAQLFFLAGQGTGEAVTRSCTVPATKPLFFPIINVECSNVEKAPFFGATDAQRAACATQIADGVGLTTLRLVLDGMNVGNLDRFRAASPPFDFTMPRNDNILFVPGKTSGRSASDGFWVLLQPPSPGSHRIHFEGAFVSGVGKGFAQDVTYELTVR